MELCLERALLCSSPIRREELLALSGKEKAMLWTILVVLLILWLLGLVSGYALGGFIHVLLVVALVVLLVQLLTGRRPVV